ncbi:MAG TPA: 23S rRNA (pseudouridine(1915)-N(3))-methyltransferase RlmH, partial [Chromatiales bacterium]|nr:23S rRNA (pseudouridine(1915)-N(3))-methyltransferase RlmH [Chromatiales bacterium]
MRIHLITVGERMPVWVKQGYEEYARRMPPGCRLRLVEIPAARRTKASDRKRLIQEEGERMLAAIPARAAVVALDVTGQPWSTPELAQRLEYWLRDGQDVALLVG